MTDRNRQIELDTALWLAVSNGDDAAIDRLLAAGGNPNVRADGECSAFIAVVQLQMFDVADKMIAAGAKVNYQVEPGISKPPLFAALLRDAMQGSTARTAYLLARGADPYVRFHFSEQSDCCVVQMPALLDRILNDQERAAMRQLAKLFDEHAVALNRARQECLVRQRKQKPGLKL